ncbi:MAG: cytochrome c peroxidase [Pseudomonadota bacterium]
MKIHLIATICTLMPFAAVHADTPVDNPACGPDQAFHAPQEQIANLGRDLFYDPILSGNKTVACATCHHPAFGTSDGQALALGDGGLNLGPARVVDAGNVPEQRIPRNAQALFNLGHNEFSVLFHDGRVERRDGGMIRTPLGDVPEEGPLSLLATLSMFPVISPDEMAGHYSENPVSIAVRRGVIQGPGGAHQILADRVAAIDAYRTRFAEVIGDGTPIRYKHVSEALAAFMALEWRADDSPFDRYLCDAAPLPTNATAGMKLFYGDADCARCHAGRFQTDHGFHAIAMPQIGPGKAERFESHARDIGRMRVTGDPQDAYKFRTPSLRNVTLTAPYGHAGSYADLRSVIRHHLDPVSALNAFDGSDVRLTPLESADDFRILRSKEDLAEIALANELTSSSLTEDDVDLLIAFLQSLTDVTGAVGRLGIPETVPSGLPVPQP